MLAAVNRIVLTGPNRDPFAMLFRFNIGKSRRGGLGLRVMPVYYMPYWRVAWAGRHRVVYRPSERTLLHLVGISGMALFVLAVITWSAGFPSDDETQKQTVVAVQDPGVQEQIEKVRKLTEELKQNLPPGEVTEIERSSARRRSGLRQQLDEFRSWQRFMRGAGNSIHWFAFIVLSMVIVLPLVGYPLQRVIIERTKEGELVVRKGGVWPSTRRWPLGTFGQIVYTPEEESSGTGHDSSTIGWRWMVKLCGSPQISIEQGLSLVDDVEIAFYIDFEEHLRANNVPPPRSVQVLVEHLCQLTGIDVVTRSEIGPEKRGIFGPRRTTTTTVTSEPEVTRHVYGSLDEVPKHLREQAGQLVDKARDGKPAFQRSLRIAIRDSDGNEQVYHSLDEMPAELRARYTRATGRTRKRKGQK